MTIELLARAALVAMFSVTAIGTVMFHGRPHRGNVNAFMASGALTLEIALIWLAGGWG